MIVLGIQTAEFPNEVGVIKINGLTVNSKLQTEKIVIKERNQTIEQLGNLTKELLDKMNLKVEDVDLVAVCLGPGSYTGLRGGLAFGKGFCQFSKTTLIGAGAFDVLANKLKSKKQSSFAEASANIKTPADKPKDKKVKSDILFMMDAKNDRVYYQMGLDGKANVSEITIVLGKVKQSTLFVGSGAVKYKTIIKNKLKEEALFVKGDVNNLDTVSVAFAGLEKFEEMKPPKDYLYTVKPQYILPPNITKPKKK